MTTRLGKRSNRELERKVRKNDPEAMHELARRLVQGEGIAEDQKRGFELAKKSSELGFIPAFTVLGYCYFYGKPIPKDEQRGVELFRYAAENGHDAAQYNMGIAYERGSVIERDYEKSYEWYQKAADQGLSLIHI